MSVVRVKAMASISSRIPAALKSANRIGEWAMDFAALSRASKDSTTVTDMFARARRIAVKRPTGPAPAMRTFASTLSIFSFVLAVGVVLWQRYERIQ